MAGNFDYMWSKLPSVMQCEAAEKYYKSIAVAFDEFDSFLDLNSKIHVIEFATGTELDDLGEMLNITRDNENDERYRARIQIFYYTFYFVPNLNNFLYLIRNIIGYYPENILEGWLDPGNEESGKLKIDIIIPAGGDDNLLIDFDKIYGAGCRLDWTKLQESYTGIHRTSNFDWNKTGLSRPYEVSKRYIIGQSLGVKAFDITSDLKITNLEKPFTGFEDEEEIE